MIKQRIRRLHQLALNIYHGLGGVCWWPVCHFFDIFWLKLRALQGGFQEQYYARLVRVWWEVVRIAVTRACSNVVWCRQLVVAIVAASFVGPNRIGLLFKPSIREWNRAALYRFKRRKS